MDQHVEVVIGSPETASSREEKKAENDFFSQSGEGRGVVKHEKLCKRGDYLGPAKMSIVKPFLTVSAPPAPPQSPPKQQQQQQQQQHEEKQHQYTHRIAMPEFQVVSSSLPSFHDELLEVIDVVQRGGILWKIPCNGSLLSGGAKRRWFRIVTPNGVMEDAILQWNDPAKPSKKPRSVEMRQVRKILTGHQTKPFFSMPMEKLPPVSLCFSLLLPERSLDLTATSEEDLNLWLEGLKYFAINASVAQSSPKRLKEEKCNKEKVVERDLGVLTSDLFDSCYENNIRLFMHIIESYPINIDVCEPEVPDGDSCLIISCKLGFEKIAEACLRFGATNDPHPEYGETALQAAVSNSQLVCAKLLLETAAPSEMDKVIVNDTDHFGNAPIHSACHNADFFMMQLLLQHGSDLSLLDARGQTVLHILSSSKQKEASIDETERQLVQSLRLLIDAGADEIINIQDDDGNAALHKAVQFRRVTFVRVLLESAANPLIVNSKGFQPHHIAVAKHRRGCLSILREYETWFVSAENHENEMQAHRRSFVRQRAVVHSSQDQELTSKEFGMNEWIEQYTKDGHTFYVNTWTGHSQWEHPGGAKQMREGSFCSSPRMKITGVGEKLRQELYRARRAGRSSQDQRSSSLNRRVHSRTERRSQSLKNVASQSVAISSDEEGEAFSEEEEEEKYLSDDEADIEEENLVETRSQRASRNRISHKTKRRLSREKRDASRNGKTRQKLASPESPSKASEEENLVSMEVPKPENVNDEGERTRTSVEETVKKEIADKENDVNLDKYVQMRKFGIPKLALRQKMAMDGILDEKLIAKVLAVPPNKIDAAVSKDKETVSAPQNSDGNGKETHSKSQKGEKSAGAALQEFQSHEESAKYLRMKKMGLQPNAIKQKMQMDQIDLHLIKLFEIAFDIAEPSSTNAVAGKKKSRRTVLKFHWKALSKKSLENTVWDSQDDGQLLPEDEELKDLEELFASKSARKTVTIPRKEQTLQEKPQRKRLVSHKRENNVSIGLAQFKKDFPEVESLAKAIDEADCSKLDASRLVLVRDLLPTSEESRDINEALMKYGRDMFLSTASTVEKFFVCILNVGRTKEKVSALIYTEQFNDLQLGLMGRIALVDKACNQIQSSQKLQTLFKMILGIGNFMNDGDVAGFSLDSLLKLGQTKAADRKTTILDYLCKLVHKKGGEDLLEIEEELSDIEGASKKLPSDIQSQVRKAEVEFRSLSTLIEEESGTKFAQIVQEKATVITPILETLTKACGDMMKATEDAISYFGESPGSCTPQHMLQVLDRFIKQFAESRAKLKRQMAAEERKRRNPVSKR